jgi:hypothetical protein
VAEPNHELHRPGLVEAQLGPYLRDVLGRSLEAQYDEGRVARDKSQREENGCRDTKQDKREND